MTSKAPNPQLAIRNSARSCEWALLCAWTLAFIVVLAGCGGGSGAAKVSNSSSSPSSSGSTASASSAAATIPQDMNISPAPSSGTDTADCGAAWASAFQQIANISPSQPVAQIQIISWNDYETGSQIEAGVANCVSLTPGISGNTLNWQVSGNTNTIDHYAVWMSTDGSTFTLAANVPAGTNALDLTTVSLPAASQYTTYVQAVGKPSVLNVLSPPVTYTKTPAYNLDTYASLVGAVTAIGNNAATLTVSAPETLSSSLTIPANIALSFQSGGILNVSSGATLTVEGPVMAAANSQVFNGSITSVVLASNPTAYPQWWGAKGDGQTDDTLAIQSALNASNNVFIPSGTYILGTITYFGVDNNLDPWGTWLWNLMLTPHSNQTISGTGTSVLKLKDHFLDQPGDTVYDAVDYSSSNAHMMGGYSLNNLTITGVTFDMNGPNNLVLPGMMRNAMAIRINGGSNITITNNYFHNSAGNNMIMLLNGTGVDIENNVLENGGQYVGSPVQNVNNTDFTFMYFDWNGVTVKNNLIEQDNIDIAMAGNTGGIEIHGSDTVVSDNIIVGCFPGINVGSTPNTVSGLQNNITVSNNTILRSLDGILLFPGKDSYPAPAINNLNITGNTITLSQSALRVTSSNPGTCAGLLVPNGGAGYNYSPDNGNNGYLENVLLQNNSIALDFSNGVLYNCQGMNLHSLHTATITQNTIIGMTFPGMQFLGSPWGSSNVQISANTIADDGVPPSQYQTGILLSLGGSGTIGSSSQPTTFTASNMTIQNNTLGNLSSSNEASGITLLNLGSTVLTGPLNICANSFVSVPIEVSDGQNAITNLESLNSKAAFSDTCQ